MTNSMIPYSFSPGTKARADEVNANFIALADKIDENKSAQSNDVKEINSVLSKKADKTELINEYTITESGTDLNNYKTNGVYVFSDVVTPSNIPNGTSGILIVTGKGDSVIKQIWFSSGDNAPIYTRSFYNYNWTGWSCAIGECSYGNPGYLKLPNGLIIQWGCMTASNITYPLAYTQVVCPVFSKQGWAADRGRSDTGFNFQTLTGFSVGSMGVFTNMNWLVMGY